MIGSALAYPVATEQGRRHLAWFVGGLLAAAVALRIAAGIYPLLLVLLPVAAAATALVVASGVCTHVLLESRHPLPSARTLARIGLRSAVVGAATLAGPVALLGWTAVSYGDAGVGLDSGAALFFLLGSTVSLVVFLAATYVVPVVIARAATEPRLRDVLERRPLRVALSTVAYLQGWAIGLPLTTLGWLLAVGGLWTTDVGGLIGILFGGYAVLAGVHAIGEGYADVPGVAEAAVREEL